MSPRSIVAVVTVAAVLPASVAGAQDLRSPDARSQAAPFSGPKPLDAPLDLRSPDARVPVTAVVPGADLRSPDAVDGAAGSRRGIDVAPASVSVSTPTVADDGFQWSDAGLGAGVIIALLVLPAGGYALVTAHRRSAGGAPLAH